MLSTAWDSSTTSLFTGDETGRLRCWGLGRALQALGAQPAQNDKEAEEEVERKGSDATTLGGELGVAGRGEGILQSQASGSHPHPLGLRESQRVYVRERERERSPIYLSLSRVLARLK